MKNLNNLLIAALTTLSFTISAQNSEEKIWVTIENNQDVPKMVNNKLVSSNETVQYLINTFEITNVEQAVPSSRVYSVQLSNGNNTMEVLINFGGGYWYFKLVRV